MSRSDRDKARARVVFVHYFVLPAVRAVEQVRGATPAGILGVALRVRTYERAARLPVREKRISDPKLRVVGVLLEVAFKRVLRIWIQNKFWGLVPSGPVNVV